MSEANGSNSDRKRSADSEDKSTVNQRTATSKRLILRFLTSFAVISFMLSLLPPRTPAQYKRTDLVSDTNLGLPITDANLVNGWGLVSTPTSPFWVSDNGTGVSTLYAVHNPQQGLTVTKQGLTVTIPPAPGSPVGTSGTPTGIVANESARTSPDFTITENGKSGKAIFIFATLDGTISGWNPAVGGSNATLAVNRSGVGAVYSGLAFGTVVAGSNTRNFLYAADDGPNRRIDVFDANFDLVEFSANAFVDPNIPKDFSPYGIQTICEGPNCQVWVTYTALNKAQGGFVDTFDTEGNLLKHFAVNGPLHSPWGIAQAPADFGPMSNAILISNNTSRGRINAFDLNTGTFLGPLRDASGKPIEIDGVWALQFGQGGAAGSNGNTNQLFFTAGPNNYANGLFGVIRFEQ